jgi:RNase P subunit RPR2
MVSKAKRFEQDVARKDIRALFRLAKETPRMAERYVEHARKLASRNRVSLREYNRVFCRKCGAYFSSATLRVRTRPTTVVYTCLRCDHMTRIPKK